MCGRRLASDPGAEPWESCWGLSRRRVAVPEPLAPALTDGGVLLAPQKCVSPALHKEMTDGAMTLAFSTAVGRGRCSHVPLEKWLLAKPLTVGRLRRHLGNAFGPGCGLRSLAPSCCRWSEPVPPVRAGRPAKVTHNFSQTSWGDWWRARERLTVNLQKRQKGSDL